MPRRIVWTLFYLLSFSIGAAEISSVEGEGRFVPGADDTQASIKEYLQANALRDVVTKEMTAMGLDADQYWKKYDEKFEEYFRPIAEDLRAKMKVPEGKTTPEFLRAVRVKRMSAYNKFGRLDRALVGFSDRGVTRNPLRPDERILQLNARIDRKILAGIYARLTTTTEYKRMKTLYLTFVPVLEQVTWEDLGVITSTDFTNVVEESWLKYLREATQSEKKPVTVEVIPPGQTGTLEEQMKKPPMLNDESTGEYAHSAWLQVHFFIRKTNDDEKTKERSFQIYADFVMIDLASHKTLLYADLAGENVTYSYAEGHNLASNLASLVYRMPMVEWAKISKIISSIPIRNGHVSLKINNAQSLSDVVAFTDFINIRAASFRPEAVLDNFTNEDATIQMRFAGEVQKLQELFLSLDQQPISDYIRLTLQDKANPFQLSLVRVPRDPKVDNSNNSETQGGTDAP